MSRYVKVFRLNFICLLVIVGVLSGCFQAKSIRIGFSAELTGRQSDLSVSMRNGVQLAIEELNASGGIDGRPIELLVEDDLGIPEGARAADQKLIDEGVVLIIGHLTSAQTMAAYTVTQQAGIILFGPTTSTSLLSGKKDLFFRLSTTNEYMGKVMTRHMVEDLGLSHIALIYDTDNLAYAEPFAFAIAETLTALGGQIAGEVTFSGSASPDFAPLVDNLRALQPDGVFIVASATNTALIAQQMQLKHLTVPLFATPWALGEVLIQSGGQAVEGLKTVAPFDSNNPPATLQDFFTRYQERYGRDAIHTAIYGYEAVQILAEGLRKTGGKAEGLPEALLETQNFAGLTGPISLDSYGDVVRPVFLQSVHNGKFETVGTLLAEP